MGESEEYHFNEIQAQWAAVRGKIRQKVGDALFKSWFKPISLISFNSGILTLSVPNQFIKTRINGEYFDLLKDYWSNQNKSIIKFKLVIVKAKSDQDNSTTYSSKQVDVSTQNKKASKSYDLSENIGASLDQRFTFSNFIVGKPNELAFAAARRVAESQDVPFNPLFLYGGVGLGKTHLMHAIAHEIKRMNPVRRVIYLSAEKFMYHFIKALRFKDTVAFKEQFRTVDVLMIDDVQFIS